MTTGRRSRTLEIALTLLVGVLIVLLVDRGFFARESSPAGTGSGVPATQVRDVGPFTGIDLVGANNVVVQVGARRSVVVHADDNLLSRVSTRVDSGRLVIGSTPGNLSAKTPMFVAVRMPSLDRLRLQGEGNVVATGTTPKLDVTLSGAGTLSLRELVARDARAVLSGDGTIMLTVTRSLDARISGDGTILYRGNPPRVAQRVTGTGTIGPG
jgi:putative autotransporter adhesin-like protein